MSKYIPTVGIEVHVELNTKTKIFSNSVNGYGSEANSLVNVVDLGYPGTLPTLNEEVINLALKAALILNCKINKKMTFDRKNYFYPDNPKNYQITQFDTPIGYDGYIEIEIDGVSKKIEIEEMHIEEDTAKSVHRGNSTYLDYNRAGVPLIEIVTKPCINNSHEATLYLEKLKETLFYAGISDCKMEEGSMRCDANVSIRLEGTEELGTKCEIKNIGSISNVGLGIKKEIVKQEEAYSKGEEIIPCTKRYDDKLQDTILMRVKETGNDYRYFPEPDIPFVIISDEMIEQAKSDIKFMPEELRSIYQEKGLSLLTINKLLLDKTLIDYLNQFLDSSIDFITASNLLLGDIKAYLNKNNTLINDTSLSTDKFISLVEKVSSGDISSRNLKDILNDILEEDKSIEDIIKDAGINNITDESVLKDTIIKVLEENSESVTEYRNGNDRVIKHLMGQVMKETKGSANPKIASDLLIELLKE